MWYFLRFPQKTSHVMNTFTKLKTGIQSKMKLIIKLYHIITLDKAAINFLFAYYIFEYYYLNLNVVITCNFLLEQNVGRWSQRMYKDIDILSHWLKISFFEAIIQHSMRQYDNTINVFLVRRTSSFTQERCPHMLKIYQRTHILIYFQLVLNMC